MNESVESSTPCKSCGAEVDKHADCTSCGESPSSFNEARYLSCSAMTSCNNCGNPLQLTGPLRNVVCEHCQRTTITSEEYWSFLDYILREVGELSLGEVGQLSTGGTRVRYQLEAPKCSHCNAVFRAVDIATGSVENVFCPGCGKAFSTYPAGELTKRCAPNVVQFFGAEREATGTSESVSSESVKPVTFACPDCNGNLKITAEHERTVTCEYCSSDCFLPDGLWRRLHPVRGRCTWYFRYHDPQVRRENATRAVQLGNRPQHEAIIREIEALAGTDDSAAEYKTFFAVTSNQERDDAASYINSALQSNWAIAETANCVMNLRAIFGDNKREHTLMRKLEVLLGEKNGSDALALVWTIKTK